jgi:predicted unusual protein kinase regulating ubiquinone biosynthesis (AarF/ABC1/UbiB family)
MRRRRATPDGRDDGTGEMLARHWRSSSLLWAPMVSKRLALTAAGAAAGALAAQRLWPRSARPPVAPVSGQRLRSRNLRLARLGVRGGGRYALHRARKTFASAERATELDTRFQLRTAEDVTNELGNMKGAMMKIGQMASYLDTGLPDSVRTTMASLQHDAPPMAPELAARQIHTELGRWPHQLFDSWDEVPIASASIGQVHRAVTRDGRAVAVKIQYPGVAEAVASDLRNAGWIFGALASLFPGVDPGPIVEEIRSRLLEELDYRLEADNQRLFHRYVVGHPFISVPAVVDELSTGRILTTDLATGSRFADVVNWSEAERNLAAETLFRFSFGAIYRLHAFNGDPHPGNYLFNPAGRVTFLDFGLVKRFDSAETVLFEDLIKQMVIRRDPAAFRKMVEDAGILMPDAPFDNATIEDYFSYYYRYVMTDGPLTIDQEYAAGGVAHLFDTTGPYRELMKYLNVPPSFVVVQRITLGLIGLFAQLGATANWQRIAMELWPFTAAPPSTPMGEEIAAWRRSQHFDLHGV